MNKFGVKIVKASSCSRSGCSPWKISYGFLFPADKTFLSSRQLLALLAPSSWNHYCTGQSMGYVDAHIDHLHLY